MQEMILGSNKSAKNAPSYKTFKELNNLITPQLESHLIDQASDLCNAAGKALAKTGGRHGKLFKIAGSLVKMTGTGGKIALQSASKVSKLPIAPAVGIAFNINQIEELHNSTATKYNDLISHSVSVIKDIIETVGSLCLEATHSIFNTLFSVDAEQDLLENITDIQNDSMTNQNESAEIAGNVYAEQFFDIYSL